MRGAAVPAALVRDLDGTFSVEEILVSAPRGAEVAVEVRAAGLCHTDLHLATTDLGMPRPLVPGHEVAGVVVEVGPRVTSVRPGDHVVASLVQYCGRCLHCLSGRTHQCPRRSDTLRASGEPSRFTQDGRPVFQSFGVGGFAARTLVHENQTVGVPREIPFPQAAILACATLTGAGSVLNAAQVRHGDSVAVVGVGGVGLNAVNAARIAGAGRIIAVDLSGPKLALAREIGATDTVDSSAVDAVQAVREITGHCGVDHAFEMIGLPDTTVQAVRMTAVGGAAYLIGLHRPGSRLDLDTMADIIQPQRSVHGIYMGAANLRRDVPRYVEHYRAGRLELDRFISDHIRLRDINEGFQNLRRGGVARSVITAF